MFLSMIDLILGALKRRRIGDHAVRFLVSSILVLWPVSVMHIASENRDLPILGPSQTPFSYEVTYLTTVSRACLRAEPLDESPCITALPPFTQLNGTRLSESRARAWFHVHTTWPGEKAEDREWAIEHLAVPLSGSSPYQPPVGFLRASGYLREESVEPVRGRTYGLLERFLPSLRPLTDPWQILLEVFLVVLAARLFRRGRRLPAVMASFAFAAATIVQLAIYLIGNYLEPSGDVGIYQRYLAAYLLYFLLLAFAAVIGNYISCRLEGLLPGPKTRHHGAA